MCGRFTLTASPEQIMEAFDLDELLDWNPSYNIAPTQDVLTIVNDGQKNRGGMMRWGLVPLWAKDLSIGNKMINARLETADEKPSFKRLMERRRCLIVADSFYEWMKEDGKKKPQRIFRDDQQLFTFAGLWDRYREEEDEYITCTILTKESNAFMQPIHHRMPVILPKSHEQEWITYEQKDATEMRDWLMSLDDVAFDRYEVDSYVNSPKNNDESCIAPLTT
ncbi:SOS response-associated peptidase [Allobacillus sp. GCM10007491]|uniref:Abasic site processing protein n=1 Tax=Allobacillus saliphilus TaxID=2912308 RepID=A0A941CV57_9BACI|nr:SOS response-associated peptidase [Allobacillus saliphilus]MBR7554427.1 SOS response-associated peptidase [Allobacillus saliphilus]